MKNCGEGIEQLQQNNATITQAIERINTAIEALQNASTGAVRHIQRGVVTPTRSTASVELIGFTNVDKMIVLFNGEAYHDSSNGIDASPRVNSLTVDTLSIFYDYYSSNYTRAFSYQVIEFY